MGWFCFVVELWLCNFRQNSCEALINLCSGLSSRRPAPPRQRATHSDIAEHGNCFCWPHPNKQLVDRLARFVSGVWINLLIATRNAAEEVAVAQSRRRRKQDERRAERAQALVAMGEISSGRAAWEGEPIARGNQATLDSLRDESRS